MGVPLRHPFLQALTRASELEVRLAAAATENAALGDRVRSLEGALAAQAGWGEAGVKSGWVAPDGTVYVWGCACGCVGVVVRVRPDTRRGVAVFGTDIVYRPPLPLRLRRKLTTSCVGCVAKASSQGCKS